MLKCIPFLLKNIVLVFYLIFLTKFNLHAQKLPLKNQANISEIPQQVQGNNNLRKLVKIHNQNTSGKGEKPKAPADNAQLRRLYELELLKDPATGLLPEQIRKKELQFAQRMNKRYGNKNARINTGIIEDWKPRGPYNVGGRTRALAIDINNENIILAGGVSGGMWRSEDGGLSWRKTTGSNDIQSVTSIVQDVRPGFSNTWYYSTGEFSGNSASDGGAFYSGNGIFKSIDGGKTWKILESSADNDPLESSPLDIIFNLAIHPATGDIYVATWWGVYRSEDGGSSFTLVLEADPGSAADVMITPKGVIYASIESYSFTNKGVLKSLDGLSWEDITPANFASDWGRIIGCYTPSDENVVYFYADNFSVEGANLWRYNYDSIAPTWTDLSANLPVFGGFVGNLNTQLGYNMLIKVHPDDPNVIFIGATNLYRSTNGFTSPEGASWIGGYSPANDVSRYAEHHPDQHALVFYPSNPRKALSGNDGGVQFTEDILATESALTPVLWTSRNNGYLTTQPYAISFDPQGTGDQIAAGFQDNGSWFTSSGNTNAPWSESYSGDGSYNAIADSGLTRYFSSQGGDVIRFNYSSPDAHPDDYTSFTSITPLGAVGFPFITPFILDPNNDNLMYIPAGRRIWRNSNLDDIPKFSYSPTAKNWKNLANTQIPSGSITALAVSKVPDNRLYYGTSRGLIYKVENAHIGDQPKIDISTGKGLPVGYISCITVDPANADRVFVVFSNYNIPSIFYSDNAGATWTNIGGNLEEKTSGKGNGPSVRWFAIEGNSDRYYSGTSTGLYTTSKLAGTSTVWTQENVPGIGNVVIPMVRTREDGLVAVASHGNGIYSARFEVTPLPIPTLQVVNPIEDYQIFVNSPNTIIDVSKIFKDSDGDSISYTLINDNPALISSTINGKFLILSYANGAKGLTSISIIASAGKEKISETFSVSIIEINNIIYKQDSKAFNNRPSQRYLDFDSALTQCADDFTIPGGEIWSIEKVYVSGESNGDPLFEDVRVIIYADAGNKPGNEVYNSGIIRPASGLTNNNFELILPEKIDLTEGTYWISVYTELAFLGRNQWFWKTTSLIRDEKAMFKDEDNIFQVGATDWLSLDKAFNHPPVDMIFTLFGKGTNIPAPQTPTNLKVSFVSDTKFDLKWNDNSSSELGFVIERSTNGSEFFKRTTVAPNTTSYSDTDFFDPSLVYYYRISAIGLSDSSAYSNVDSTAIIPQAPKAKLASFVFSSFFITNWEPSLGAKYYELDISPDNFTTYLKGYEGKKINTTTYLVWGTQYNKQYKYRVRAVNAGGESKSSNLITVQSTKNLSLASVCANNPSTIRRWRITNPNPFDVGVEWSVYKSNQKGTLMAPPGQSYFTTNIIPGSNTTYILWQDDKCLPHLAVKTSSNAKCTGNINEIAEGRSIENEEIATDSPFIIDAWPNPSKEKFNIVIMSPFEDEVEMEIFSVKGDRIYKGKSASNTVVEVDALQYPAGIYILKAKQSMYNQTIKLIKQ